MKRIQIAEERRAQILAGALKAFSTKGFANATNKEIAEAAGIQSPGLIYHYFKDKADLLRQVIQAAAPPLHLAADPARLIGLPIEEGLMLIGNAYLAMLNSPEICDGLRVLIGEALRDKEFSHTLGESGPLRIWRLMRDYLALKVESGEIRPCDPSLAAWSFLGGLFVYVFGGRLLDFKEAQIIDANLTVAHHVNLMLRGLAPVEGGRQ